MSTSMELTLSSKLLAQDCDFHHPRRTSEEAGILGLVSFNRARGWSPCNCNKSSSNHRLHTPHVLCRHGLLKAHWQLWPRAAILALSTETLVFVFSKSFWKQKKSVELTAILDPTLWLSWFCLFSDRVSLSRLGWPWTCSNPSLCFHVLFYPHDVKGCTPIAYRSTPYHCNTVLLVSPHHCDQNPRLKVHRGGMKSSWLMVSELLSSHCGEQRKDYGKKPGQTPCPSKAQSSPFHPSQ